MLADKDRIFTNLYGFESPGLEAAKKRGQWDNTKAIIDMGPETIVDIMKKSGLRGRGGAGFPDRPEMVLHAQGSEGASALSRRQCRRVRARHLQGPGHHAQRSAHAGRRLPDRVFRDAGACLLHLCPRRSSSASARRLQRAVDEAYAAMADRQEQRPWLGFRPLCPSRGRGLYLRRGNRAAGKPGRQEGPAAARSRHSPANVGLYGCPTTVNNVESIAVAPTILRRGADWFAGIGRPNNTGTKLFCISGHVNKPCNVEEEMGIPLQRADRKALRRRAAAAGTICWPSSPAALRCRCCPNRSATTS